MLPFVVQEVPGSPIQVAMEGSVGYGGTNQPADVQIVQSLLNAVPSNYGGPDNPLDIDGLVGPCTIGAIQNYQFANLGFADGRVDRGKQTIRSLVALTQNLGTLPINVPGLGPPPPSIAGAFGGSGASTIGSAGLSTWQFTSSAAISVSVGKFGVTAGILQVVEDSQPNINYHLKFAGFGVGANILPAGFSASTLSGWSSQLRILKGILAPNPFDKPGDFLGPCAMLSIDAGVGPGINGTFVNFGAGAIVGQPLTAFGFLAGITAGMSGFGVTVYLGAVVAWS